MVRLLACIVTACAYVVMTQGTELVVSSARRLFGTDRNFAVKPTTGGYALVDEADGVFGYGKPVTGLEYQGMTIYGAYLPESVPKILGLDREANILYTEWLSQHKSLHTTLIHDNLDVDISRAVGTVLGRSHAASHSELEIGLRSLRTGKKRGPVRPQDQQAIYRHLFRNEESFSRREERFRTVQKYLCDIGNQAALDALETLHSSHQQEGSRSALIHGDLTAEAVLVPSSSMNQGNRANLKVRSFQNFAYGPPGCDLGSFLASYVWYHAAHANPSRRRALRVGVAEVLSSYVSAFRAQALASPKIKSLGGAGVATIMEGILKEASGYLGMSLLRLLGSSAEIASAIPESGFRYDALPELRWGDSNGRVKSVRKRQTDLACGALLLYHRTSAVEGGGDILSQVNTLLQSDEDALLTAHQTEFWY